MCCTDAVLIIDMYFALSSSDMNSESSNYGWSPSSIGLDCFCVSPLETFTHRYLTFYIYIPWLEVACSIRVATEITA